MGERRLFYWVLFRSKRDRTPAGIAVQGVDGTEGHGLVWSHRAGAWRYDPTAASQAVGGSDWDLSEELSREEAERAALTATGQQLPDEDTIWWIFQWKGDPPQNQD